MLRRAFLTARGPLPRRRRAGWRRLRGSPLRAVLRVHFRLRVAEQQDVRQVPLGRHDLTP